MPLTHKGEVIKKALQEEYGEERGESVLYAGKNKGTFTGIDQRARSLDEAPPSVAVSTTPPPSLPAVTTTAPSGLTTGIAASTPQTSLVDAYGTQVASVRDLAIAAGAKL
jgi:hypothetical protein